MMTGFSPLVRLTSRLCIFAVLLLVISSTALAQSEEIPTETPVDTPIETPTEMPTEIPSATTVPTEVPTQLPTDTPIPTATETIPVISPTAEVTEVVTDEPLPTNTLLPTVENLQPEPELGLLFSDHFDSGDLSQWSFGTGWAFIERDAGKALQVFNSSDPGELMANDVFNAAVQAAFLVDNGTAQLSVRRSTAGSYSVTLDKLGIVTLYRSGVLLQSAAAAPSTVGQWRVLRLSAMGGTLRVMVDGVEVIGIQDTEPLPPGKVAFSGALNPMTGITLPQNTVQVDDFFLFVPLVEMPSPTPEAATAVPPTPSPVRPNNNSEMIVVQSIQTYTVNTTDDVTDGVCNAVHCSLREAITAANANAGIDTIAFNIAGAIPHTILPTFALPTITEGVIIDGKTEPDFAGLPVVELSGANLGVVDGLTLTSSNSVIRGLAINRFGGNGIKIVNGASNTIEGNIIGLDVTGTIDLGNGTDGILINNSSNNVIGGTSPAKRNLISGNTGVGVRIAATVPTSSMNNIIAGNFIGADVTGTVALVNTGIGVYVQSGQSNTIGGLTGLTAGGSCTGSCNLIVSTANGIKLFGSSNVVQGNYIGVNVSGTAALGSPIYGIEIMGSSNLIGSANGVGRNIIAGYTGAGIWFSGGSTIIQGNYIGTDVTGSFDLVIANASGIYSQGTASGVIGGPSGVTSGGGCTGACNLISGSANGIYLFTNGNSTTIQGNAIGTNAAGTGALGNTIGIRIENAQQNMIGGTASNAGNLISGNTDGISITNGTNNTIVGNAIGTNSSQNAALGNLNNAVFISSGSGNQIGSTTGNTIAYNGGAGIAIQYSTGNKISSNRLYSNTGLGIDLLPAGVTSNDNNDGDSGANNLQNFPVLTTVGINASAVGTLNSTPNQTFRVEIFGSDICDSSGFGEGKTLLGYGDVTTDASGNASLNIPLTNVGKFVTATAADSTGNTSEFSACIAALNPPSNFSITVSSPTNILLNWMDNTDAEIDYRVERSYDGSNNWTEIAVLGPNTNSYNDNNVVCGLPYYYRVRTYYGDPSQFSDYTAILDAQTLCSLNAPTNLTITSVDSTQIGLSWTDNATDETAYFIERSTDGSNWVEIASIMPFYPEYLDRSVVCEIGYFYRVRVGHYNGQRSPYSNVVNVSTPLCKPTSLTATATSISEVHLVWVDNATSETAYKVERFVGASGWMEVASLPAGATSYDDNTLSCNIDYSYRVRAHRSSDNLYSSYSDIVPIITPLCPPADLSMSKTVNVPTASEGDTVTYTVTVTNSGPNPAPGVLVRDLLPTSLNLLNVTVSQGSYNASSGLWIVGDISANNSQTMTLTVRVGVGYYNQTIINQAQVTRSNAQDPDSIPGNAVIGEDDLSQAPLTVVCAPSSIFNVPAGDTFALNAAISAANNETCYPGPNTITLAANSTYTLTKAYLSTYPSGNTGLPTVISTITIEGNGATIERDVNAPAFRLLMIEGDLTLNNITLRNGLVDIRDTGSGNTYIGYGGAIYHRSGTVNINNSAILDSSAATYGGGIYTRGTMTITNSLLHGNHSILYAIGAAVMSDGTLTIINSTIAQNKADSSSSAIIYHNPSGKVTTLIHNTLVGNTVYSSAGVVEANFGSIVMRGNLLMDTQGNNCPSAPSVVSQGYNISDDASCAGYLSQPTDLNNVAMQVGIVANNGGATLSYAPFADSPAVDAIPAAECTVATDQRGFARPTDSDGDSTAACDIGSVEVGRADLVIDKQADRLTAGIGDQIVYTVSYTNNGPDQALGVVVSEPIPTKVTFVSANATQGSYNPASGLWTIGQVNAGSTVTLTLTVTVNFSADGSTIVNEAIGIAASVNDPDGAPSDSVTVTVNSCSASASFVVADGDVAGLIDAIDAANNETCYPGPNTITLATNGSYTLAAVHPDGSGDANGLPIITSTIVIEGSGSTLKRSTTAPQFRLFMVDAVGSLTLNDLTVRDGAYVNGAAVLNAGTLTINDSILRANTANGYGGAIYNTGTLNLTNTSLLQNTSANGGAVASWGSVTITGGSFSDNTANSLTAAGGAISILEGTGTITNTAFSQNEVVATSTVNGGGAVFNAGTLTITGGAFSSNFAIGTYSNGGAIYNHNLGNLTVANASFDNNMAVAGGGIFSNGGVLNVTGSTFYANVASDQGGGIYGLGAITLTNSTFSGNTADRGGGLGGGAEAQIRFSTFYGNNANTGSAIDSHGNLTITASILTGATGNNCNSVGFNSGGYNISNDASCGFGSTGDQNNINPLLDSLRNNGGPTKTHALLNGSPALNAVPVGVCTVATDQRGVTRPQGSACEIGAYEGDGIPSNTRLHIANVNSVADTGDGTLADNEAVDVEISQLIVKFSKPVQNPAGNSDPHDVTNLNNYRLISAGANNVLQTAICGVLGGDDQLVPINSVSYDAGSYTSTITVNDGTALSPDRYRLVVCASIKDADGNGLDGNNDGFAGDDFARNFSTEITEFRADLVVTQTDNPDPVLVGSNLTYTVTVSNSAGPQNALNVVLTDTLPNGVTFGSASPGCAHNVGIVTCDLGTVLRGTSKQIQITVTVGATTIATLSNRASATSIVTDPNPFNNTNSTETTNANESPATNLVANTTGVTLDGVCGLIHCSLRDAITVANSRPGVDTISFNIPGAGPYVIQPFHQLESISEGVIIDGWSQPGYSGQPIIIIDGEQAGSDKHGLVITGGGSTVRGLVIGGFGGDGIVITGGGGNTIVGNYIGTNTAGTAANGNRNGIRINNSPNNVIGGILASERNIISGNSDRGIVIEGAASSGTIVRGNFIGTNPAGTVSIPNLYGIATGAPNTTIGGTQGTTPDGNCTGACNLISGNGVSGIWFGTSSTIQGNFIGTDVTGKVALANGISTNWGDNGYGVGIYSNGASPDGSLIGGTTPAARNVISGNALDGIYLTSNTPVTIQGNYIGVDTTGTIDLGNDANGIFIYTTNNLIIDNVISGNWYNGIRLENGSNIVQGNRIGTNAAGNSAIPNRLWGIGTNNAPNVTIGGSAPEEGNVISGNGLGGISLSGGDSVIQGNFIGTTASGTAPLGNTGHGIYVSGGPNNLIGGTNPGEGNVIAYNTGNGFHLYHYATLSRVSGNSIFANGGIGIDLTKTFANAGDGVTLNDPGDADTGANNLQNFPVISDASSSGGQVNIVGSLNSTANQTFHLEFFANTTCDSSEYGEGEIYLGSSSYTTDASGNLSFNVTLPGSYTPGTFYTATATDVNGNTSEFSACASDFDPPSDLTAVSISETKNRLNWVDNTTGEDAFVVERSVDGLNGWTVVATLGANVTTFDNTGLTCTTTYFYRVRARSNSGAYFSAYSNVALARPCTQQGPVFIVTHTTGTDDSVCDLTHCTLREAIKAANGRSGLQTIQLAADAVYTFNEVDNTTSGANGLPAITGEIVVNGNGAIIERSTAEGTPRFRLFYVHTGGKLTLNEITVRNGYAASASWPNGNGGGLYNNGGQLTVNRSTIANNTASYSGGISNIRGGVLVVNNSTISGNDGDYNGGGIGNDGDVYTNAGTVTITNSTISGNSASFGGGVSSAQLGTMTIINSTIVDNFSFSGTFYNFGSPTFTLRGSIVSGSLVCGNLGFTSGGYNIISDNSCNFSETGDLNNTNPVLEPLADNGGSTMTHALQPSSPALDTMPAASCTVSADQRGVSRPIDGNSDTVAACDIGAYELTQAPIADLSLEKIVSNVQPTAGETITYTLIVTNHGPSASDTQVTDVLPANVTFVDAAVTQGTYDDSTGIWDVQIISADSTATLNLTVQINAGTAGQLIANTAEITQSSVFDLDSTPNNANPAEDDYDKVEFTVLCPVNPFNVAAGDVSGLRAAITAANNELCYPGLDTITLAANSTYTLTDSVMVMSGNNGLPLITSAIVIDGNGAVIERSSVVGTPQFRLMQVDDGGILTIDNLTLRGGYANGSSGGAILNHGEVTITNTTLTNNGAYYSGGAVSNALSTKLTIIDSVLSENSAVEGGALYNYRGTVVNLTNTSFFGNTAEQQGGGIHNRGALNITGSELDSMTSNSAIGGGAIYNGPFGVLTLTSSTLSNNTARNGSAIQNEAADVTIINSTLTNNAVTGATGYTLINTGTLTVTNSTLADNTALEGIIGNWGGTTTLKATILANSPSPNCLLGSGSILSEGYNVTDDGSCSGYLTDPTDQNGVNPSLGALANNGGPTNTYSLQIGSLAIDVVPLAECEISQDQRGIVRPQGDACDAGSYEAQAALDAPAGLSGEATSSTGLTLNWTDTFNETEFRIERSLDGTNNWEQIAVVAVDVVTYADSGLACNTAYAYRVRAFRDVEALLSGYSNTTIVTTGGCQNADLEVRFTQVANPVMTGTQQTYTTTVRNLGPLSATGVELTITLPEKLTFISTLPNQGAVCTHESGAVTCELGTVANGGVKTVEWIAVISPDARGALSNTAAVSHQANDPNPQNNTISLITDLTLPGMPGITNLLTPTNGLTTNQAVVMMWNGAVNAYWYQIQIDDDSRFGSPSIDILVGSTTYTANNLADGRHYWRVRSVNSILQAGAWSSVRNVVVDTAVPGVPTLGQPAADGVVTTARPVFRWLRSLTASKYRLQVATTINFTTPLIDVEVSTTSYTSTVVLPQGTYYWRVQARDVAGNWSGYGNSPQTFNMSLQMNPAAGGFVTDTTPALQWAAYPGAVGYQVELAGDANFVTSVSGYPKVVTAMSHSVSSVLAQGVYYWRVSVDVGSGFVSSPFVRSFTVTGTPPIAPRLSNPSNGMVVADSTPLLMWEAVTGATQYEIEVDNDSRFRTPEVDTTVSSTSHSTSTLASGRYYWRVRSLNSWGAPGAWSSVRNVVIDTVAPSAPTLSQPTAGGMVATARPVFRWAQSSTANKYRLQVATTTNFTTPLIDAEVITTTYTSILVLPQGTYYWRVQARDAAGNWGGYSSSQAFQMNIQMNPVAGAFVTDTTPALQWAAYPGAVGYQLELASDAGFTSPVSGYPKVVTGTSHSVSSVLAQGVYYWRVSIDVGSGFVSSPFVRSFTVTGTPPIAPRQSEPLNGAVVADSTPLLSWQVVTDAAHYEIEVDNDSRFRTLEVDTTVSSTSHTTSALADGRYYWRVRSLNTWGAPGAWSSVRNVVVDTAAPGVPTLSQPVADGVVTTTRPIFRWLRSLTASKYRLQVATTAGFSNPLIDVEVSTTSYTSILVLPQGTYYWRVQARDVAGNWSGYGSSAQVFQMSLQMNPVAGGFVTDTTPALQWAAYPGAVGYQLELASDAGFTSPVSGYPKVVTATSHSVSSVLAQGVYYWRVSVDVGSGLVSSPFVRSFTVTGTPPIAPRQSEPLNGAVVADSTPLLSWQVVTGATHYEIEVDNDSRFRTPEVDTTVSSTSHTTSALADGRYYWRVRSLNTWGAPGAWSSVRSFTIDGPDLST